RRIAAQAQRPQGARVESASGTSNLEELYHSLHGELRHDDAALARVHRIRRKCAVQTKANLQHAISALSDLAPKHGETGLFAHRRLQWATFHTGPEPQPA